MRGQNLSAIILLSGLFLVCSASPSLSSESSERTLHFPANRSMGTLFVRDAGSGSAVEWTELGEAQGDVAVPAGKKLRLVVSQDAAHDISPLATLRPDDLSALEICNTYSYASLAIGRFQIGGFGQNYFLDGDMVHLAELTSLREINLDSTAIGDAGLSHLKGMSAL